MTEPSSSLVIEELPSSFRSPILLAAFSGWNDAAESATTAAKFLCERWSAHRVAHIEAEEFFHFGLLRPEVRFKEGSETVREVHWPTNEFFLSQEESLPRDVLTVIGIEPHLKWQTFTGHIIDLARRCGVTMVITLGALLADVPHTRPVRVNGVATDAEVGARLRTTRTRYQGPTGIVGVLNDACRRTGLPAVSLWANVPHYVSEVSNPHAVLALVGRVLEFLEWTTDLTELEDSAVEFDRQLTRIVQQKPEVARYITELEKRAAESEAEERRTSGELPGAQELIREVEQFLREHRRDNESE
jgi:proteasome assembly chaperone (PAC2) family protein